MELYIIADPHGAGKTTFAREFLPNYADCKNFVNADLIAQEMAPFSPETAAVRAGTAMLHEIRSFRQACTRLGLPVYIWRNNRFVKSPSHRTPSSSRRPK